VPTLHIWSTGDPALSRAGAEATGQYVEAPYRFEVLDGVSHWIPEHAVEVTNRLLLEQFAAHPG
jgi:pimeloyl-ACP methyl ester carboxylesterase